MGKERESELFKHIVLKTNLQSIGPLEYVGNARLVGPHDKYDF
jgi:hypothetical protein